MRFSLFLRPLVVPAAGALLVLAGCGELKSAAPADGGGAQPGTADAASPGAGSSSGGSTDGSTSLPVEPTKTPPPGYGPGPLGSLPSGYCCKEDAECRSRHCEDLGGGKMCLDICRSSSTCQRPPELAWACDNGGSPGVEGLCRPDGAFTCIPAAQFELGTKVPGDCCTATGDGWAGLECTGGRCIAIGDNPFVCSQLCTQPKDCPGGFVCHAITETRKECIPANRPYTCN